MKSTEERHGPDAARILNTATERRILVQCEVSPHAIIVVGVSRQDSA